MNYLRSYSGRVLSCLLLWALICGTTADAIAQMDDTTFVNRLYDNSVDSMDIDPQHGIINSLRALNISERINYLQGKGFGPLLLGKLYNRTGNPDKAREYLLKAVAAGKEYHRGKLQSSALHELSIVCMNSGDFKQAFSYMTDALNVNIAYKDTVNMAESYKFIGNYFSERGDYDEALKYLNKAAGLYTSLNDPTDYANLCSILAATYFDKNELQKGLNYLYEAIGIYKKINDTIGLSVPYQLLAEFFQTTHKYDSALFYDKLAVKLAISTGHKTKQALTLKGIAELYTEMGNYAEAEKNYKQALSISKEITFKRNYYEIPYSLGLLYAKTGNYKDAFAYMDSAYAARDSFLNEEKEKTMAEMTARFSNSELESKNKLLQKENDIEKIRLQRKNILIYSSLGAAILFLVIGMQVVRQNRLKANQKLLQLEQKQLLSQMNPHFIFNCLNSIQQYVVQNDAENANKYLADFALLMRQTLDNSKDGIIPLQREIDYLENYLSLESMRFDNKFSYTVACADNVNRNTLEIPSMIIQPFVENAIHHGLRNLENREGQLRINFYKKSDDLFCEVDDNGIGMEKAQKLKEQRFIKYQSHGMELTKQRLALVSKMNGTDYHISVVNKLNDRQEPEGTKIIIKFPIKT
jgi:tetratricopeptide (TPR) repeat protein